MAEFHVGEVAVCQVELKDAAGNDTKIYDEVEGIRYTSTHPDCARAIDDDADPTDARVEFLQLSPDGVDVFIDVRLDGKKGSAVNEINLRSEPIRVVAGEAASGEVTLKLMPVEPIPAAEEAAGEMPETHQASDHPSGGGSGPAPDASAEVAGLDEQAAQADKRQHGSTAPAGVQQTDDVDPPHR